MRLGKNSIYSVILLLAIPVSSGAAAQEPNAPQSPQDARQLLFSGDYRGAETAARGVLERAPDDAAALAVLSMVLSNAGRGDEASAAVQHALSVDANLPLAHLALGRYFWSARDYDKAAAAFRLALSRNPTDVIARLHLGAVHYVQDQYTSALAEWIQALRDVQQESTPVPAPRDLVEATLRFNLGNAYNQVNAYPLAEKEYRRAVGLQDSNPRFHAGLASALFYQGRQAEAAAEGRRAWDLGLRDHPLYGALHISGGPGGR